MLSANHRIRKGVGSSVKSWLRGEYWGDKLIAAAAYCSDNLLSRKRITESLSKPEDRHAERSITHDAIRPEVLEKFLLRHDAFAMANEIDK
jgi:hypothetical protein